jgi:hypothetical protein
MGREASCEAQDDDIGSSFIAGVAADQVSNRGKLTTRSPRLAERINQKRENRKSVFQVVSA